MRWEGGEGAVGKKEYPFPPAHQQWMKKGRVMKRGSEFLCGFSFCL